jgi:hypothetical protein
MIANDATDIINLTCNDQAVAKFVKEYYMGRSASHEFSMLALTGAK